jgi:outer membrane receptor for ferrienterochelin and colicins
MNHSPIIALARGCPSVKSLMRIFHLFFSAAILILAPAVAGGAPPDSAQTDPQKNPFALDLDSLLNMKVFTASKFSENLVDAPGVITVVTRDELRRFGGITLREILERVAGLSGSTASFTDRSIISVRGDQTKINGGHILYLINGRPTREILEGGISGDLLEAFPVTVLERIEVVRGPGSVLYGSNAFSGVVNLITQKAESDGLTVSALGSAGPGVATSGQASLRRGNFSLLAAGQFHQKPGWSTLCYTSYGGLEHPEIPDRGKGGYLSVDYKGLSVMSSFTEWKTSYIEGAVGEARWDNFFQPGTDCLFRFRFYAGQQLMC